MEIKKYEKDGQIVVSVYSKEKVIIDIQSALDFLMSIRYEYDCDGIALNKEAITDDFFVLSTCIAGDIYQKFTNYQLKFAIYGDFSHYTSKPLKDFIYECNHGKDFFFMSTVDEAIEKLISNL